MMAPFFAIRMAPHYQDLAWWTRCVSTYTKGEWTRHITQDTHFVLEQPQQQQQRVLVMPQYKLWDDGLVTHAPVTYGCLVMNCRLSQNIGRSGTIVAFIPGQSNIHVTVVYFVALSKIKF